MLSCLAVVPLFPTCWAQVCHRIGLVSLCCYESIDRHWCIFIHSCTIHTCICMYMWSSSGPYIHVHLAFIGSISCTIPACIYMYMQPSSGPCPAQYTPEYICTWRLHRVNLMYDTCVYIYVHEGFYYMKASIIWRITDMYDMDRWQWWTYWSLQWLNDIHDI